MKRGCRAALALLLAACGSSSNTQDAGFTGNPLGVTGKGVPVPSGIYEKDDPASPTGVRLDVPVGALPANSDRAPFDVAQLNSRDGWSADAPILTNFPGGVDPSNLPKISDPASSLQGASPTVIVDETTGQRVPHFAELDMNAAGHPDDQALILRPVVRLQEKHRYAVGITTALRAPGGGALPVAPGLRAIIDGTPGDALLERVRPRYAGVFRALAGAGVAKENLVAAWDFTVASDAGVAADLTSGRDAALAAIAPNAANLTFDVSDDPVDDPSLVSRVIRGHFDAPLVLTAFGTDDGVLARDAYGVPQVVGMYRANYYAFVPACAATAAKPIPAIIYGHGLLGSGSEVNSRAVRLLANQACAVGIATDWKGMSMFDLGSVVKALRDANKFGVVVDHLVQGMIDFVALEQILRGPMIAAGGPFQGLVDPSRIYYYGNSQGGIYGGTFLAIDPVVTRGILGVPGANYSMLLERSADWPRYESYLGSAYPSYLDEETILMLDQMRWDTVDPITFTPVLPGAKQLLMIEARHDSQVPNIGTETQVRSMGIPVLAPAVVVPYGVTATAGPLGSALTIVDEHKMPYPPDDNTSLADNGTHGSVRYRQAVIQQMSQFLQTGQIVQTCSADGVHPAACDCPTDAVCGPGL